MSQKLHCGRIQRWRWAGFIMTPTDGIYLSETVSGKYKPTLRTRNGNTVEQPYTVQQTEVV